MIILVSCSIFLQDHYEYLDLKTYKFLRIITNDLLIGGIFSLNQTLKVVVKTFPNRVIVRKRHRIGSSCKQ